MPTLSLHTSVRIMYKPHPLHRPGNIYISSCRPYNANESEEDDEGEEGDGDVSLGSDVRVAQPEQVDQYEPSDDEHEGGVWTRQPWQRIKSRQPLIIVIV